MRKLCVFNPSHDSVMQYGTRAVTPPQIATKMWQSMGALACLWGDDERSDALTEDMIGSDGYAKFTNGKPVYSSRTKGYTYSTVNSSDVLLNPEYGVTQNVYPYYFVKGHLGSNRMVADNPSTMVSYYPYGGIYYDDFRFYQADDSHLYNGKEMDRIYGLEWLDYGARMDNPAIGLWTQMDPLAEKYYHINPYVYCAGNPVMFIDPDGREWGEKELENGQNIIYANVELINNIKNLSLEEIEEYKNAVSQTFNQMVSAASNGEYVAQINFNAPQEERQLHLQTTWEESGNQASVAGKTFGNISITYLCCPTGDRKIKMHLLMTIFMNYFIPCECQN